jgi:hypothetical protein
MRKKKCKVCAEWFIPERNFQPCCKRHEYEYAIDQLNKKRKLDEAKNKKDQREKKKAFRAKSEELRKNDRPYQFQLTKRVIQRWVNNVRDAGLPCISCGTTKLVQYCGGHYKSAGGHPELALDTKNLNRQCNQYCNLRLSGNIHGNKTSPGYIKGILDRFGQERLDYLDGHHEPKKYTCEQLIELRAFYSKLIREENKDDSQRPF